VAGAVMMSALPHPVLGPTIGENKPPHSGVLIEKPFLEALLERTARGTYLFLFGAPYWLIHMLHRMNRCNHMLTLLFVLCVLRWVMYRMPCHPWNQQTN
jgi:hypothetical protein